MCPLRYVLAMLTALALLYCLAVLAMDSSGGVGGGDSADARPSLLGSLGAARLSAGVARARRRSCWRFTVSCFTGELLMDSWRGDASGHLNMRQCRRNGGEAHGKEYQGPNIKPPIGQYVQTLCVAASSMSSTGDVSLQFELGPTFKYH